MIPQIDISVLSCPLRTPPGLLWWSFSTSSRPLVIFRPDSLVLATCESWRVISYRWTTLQLPKLMRGRGRRANNSSDCDLEAFSELCEVIVEVSQGYRSNRHKDLLLAGLACRTRRASEPFWGRYFDTPTSPLFKKLISIKARGGKLRQENGGRLTLRLWQAQQRERIETLFRDRLKTVLCPPRRDTVSDSVIKESNSRNREISLRYGLWSLGWEGSGSGKVRKLWYPILSKDACSSKQHLRTGKKKWTVEKGEFSSLDCCIKKKG